MSTIDIYGALLPYTLEEPTPGRMGGRGGGGSWQAVCNHLRANHPGQWAKLTLSPTTGKPFTSYKSGTHIRKYGAEVVVRRNDDGAFVVYVRVSAVPPE